MISAIFLFVSLLSSVSTRSVFIVGGSDSDIADFPWQGSWRRVGSHSCGCVLVDPGWILTAGHCVGGAIDTYTAGFGNSDRNNLEVYDIAAITLHPNYDTGFGYAFNDIAVVQPASAVVLGPNVATIAVAADAVTPVGADCSISGWGRLDGGEALPDILQSTPIPVIDDDLCQQRHGDRYQRESMICVWGGVNGTVAACNGDSGGPVNCNIDGTERLYGLASWVIAGCQTEFPSVYNRVGAFREWICETTENTVAC